MPDYYFGYAKAEYPNLVLEQNARMNSESTKHVFGAARQAQNGNFPIYITRTAFYASTINTGGDCQMEFLINGNVYRTNSYRINDTNWNWRWYDQGLGLYFGNYQQISKISINYGNNVGSTRVGGDSSGADNGSRWSVNGPSAKTFTPGQMIFAYSYQQVPTPANNVRAYSSSGTYGAVDVYWDGPSDWGDATPTGFDIHIAGVGLVQRVGMQYGTTISGLNPNQGYTFYVAARNSLSDTAGTSSVMGSSGSAAASSRPDGVYSLRAYQSGNEQGRIDLYWDAPWAGSAAQYVDYYIYIDGQGPSAVTRGLNYSFYNMGNWQYHNFFVVAANQFGAGPNGNTTGATSPGVPSAVYNLRATTSYNVSGRLSISWSPPAQTSGGIVRYTIYQSNGGQVAQVDGNTTQVTLDGWNPGTQYPFDVRAWNQWGANIGQYGDSVPAVYVTADGNPTAPQNLNSASISSTIGSVRLQWTTPSNTGIGPIRFYNVYEDGNFLTSTSGDTQIVLNGRNSNTSHTYAIAPRNTWNLNNNTTGPWSNNQGQYVPGVPSAPQNLGIVASTTTAGLITVSWVRPAVIGGYSGTITRYVITRTNADGGTITYQTTNTSYDVSTTPKTATNYYVVAFNDAGDAANTPSNRSSTVSTTSNGGATQPTYVTITPATNTIARLSMTWLPPAGSIVSYTINRSDGTNLVKKVITGTRYTDDTVASGQTYVYQIQATNTTNTDGDLSDPVSATANTTSSQGVANLVTVNNTNSDLSGDYTLNSNPSGNALSYRQITPNYTLSSVPLGSGTIVDKTNVFLNGQYFGIATNATQIDIAKPGTPFNRTAVTGGTLTDNTNVILNGTKNVTAISPATKAFNYNATYMNTSQRPAAGTIRNYTNEVFNNGGNPVTITGATYNAFTYYIAGSNVSETTAIGSALDITNRDFFNGHYNVAAVLSPTQITYERVPQNMRAALTNYVKNPRFETAGSTFVYRTNLCTNPSFEVSTAGWTAGSAVSAIRSTSIARTGTASMLVTKNALTDSNSAVSMTLSGLVSGATYSISGYFRSGNGDSQPYFSVTGRSSSNPIVLTTDWQRSSYTFTANSTSHVFNIQSGVASVATSNFYVDNLMIENTLLVSSYFDGDTAATEDHTFAWTGTAGVSTSNRIATAVSGVANGGGSGVNLYAVGHRNNTWYIDGTHSLAMITRGAAAYQNIDITGLIGQALAPNRTYTFKATFKTVDSIINPNQIYFNAYNNTNGATSIVNSGIIGTPGIYTFAGTFTTNGFADANNTFQLYNRTDTVGSSLYLDSVMVVDGDYRNTDVFTGATANTLLTRYAWTGAADNSTTSRVTDLSYFSGGLSARTGGVARSDNPAGMDIFYRSGWLG